LLEGADIEAENISGRTAIDLAIDKGYFPIAHYLLAWRKQGTDTKDRLALPPEAPDTDTAPDKPDMAPIVTPEPVVEPAPVHKQASQPVVEEKPEPVVKKSPEPVTPVAPTVAEAKPEPVPVKETPQEAGKIGGLAGTKLQEKTTGFFDKITNFFTPEPEKAEDLTEKQQQAAPVAPEAEKAEDVTAAPEKLAEAPDVLKSITDFFSPKSPETATKENQQKAPAPAAPKAKQPEPMPEPMPEPVPEPVIVAEPAPVEPTKKETVEASPKEESEGTILGRISEFLQPTDDQPPPAKPLDKPKIQETAAITPASVARMDHSPFLSTKMSLGRNQPKIPGKPCIERKTSKSLFCIEPVKWPGVPGGVPGASQDIGASFEAYTTLYRGQKTIVHYENGRAKQFHSLFPRKNFGAIIDYFTKRFGAPSQTPNIRAVLIGQENRKNRTARWLGPKQTGAKAVVLEVREFDDLRWSSPADLRYGAVWLHYQGDDPVFRFVSWSDFLLARVRK